jgi:alpha-N-arabinofuranosidase
MAFLGIRPQNGRFHHLGRETFLAPVVWSGDGWPVVNEGRNITLEMPAAPSLAPHSWPPEPIRDDFDAPVLAPVWNRLRKPRRGRLFPRRTPRLAAPARVRRIPG